jgi:hypothetical protein
MEGALKQRNGQVYQRQVTSYIALMATELDSGLMAKSLGSLLSGTGDSEGGRPGRAGSLTSFRSHAFPQVSLDTLLMLDYRKGMAVCVRLNRHVKAREFSHSRNQGEGSDL